MRGHKLPEFPFEVERYELYPEYLRSLELNRRAFLEIVGSGGVVALLLGDAVAQQPGQGRRPGGGGTPQEIGGWLHLGDERAVTGFTRKRDDGPDRHTPRAPV